MTTVMPSGENTRRAVRWISAHLNENPDQNRWDLINQATQKFDLNPKETNGLIQFYSNKNTNDQ